MFRFHAPWFVLPRLDVRIERGFAEEQTESQSNP